MDCGRDNWRLCDHSRRLLCRSGPARWTEWWRSRRTERRPAV